MPQMQLYLCRWSIHSSDKTRCRSSTRTKGLVPEEVTKEAAKAASVEPASEEETE